MIDARNVTKTYNVGGEIVSALDDITFELSRGVFSIVIGPSGSGKSTLLYTLGGLLTPDWGTVRVNGSDIYAMNHKQKTKFRRDNIGFIFQTFELLPYLTALENVMIPLSLNRRNEQHQEEIGIQSLERVGLGKRINHKPSELSGGEQQRVAIARGLVNNPNLLLADEPTGNLDRATGDDIISLLLDLNREGQTIILVTHDKSKISIADRVLEIVDGKLISG